MFGERRAWFLHELEHHRVQWQCRFCTSQPFQDKGSLEAHLARRHHELCSASQLHSLLELSRQPPEYIEAKDCPFCDDFDARLRSANGIEASKPVFISPTQFSRHVASHMEQLALFAIPRGYLETDEMGSGKSDMANIDEHKNSQASAPRSELRCESLPRPTDRGDAIRDSVGASLWDGERPISQQEHLYSQGEVVQSTESGDISESFEGPSLRPDPGAPQQDQSTCTADPDKARRFRLTAQSNHNEKEPFYFRLISAHTERNYTWLDGIRRHKTIAAEGKCDSGVYCVAQGGKVTEDPETFDRLLPHFEIIGRDPSRTLSNDNKRYKLEEGAVQKITFLRGVPSPPVKRLPAKFECPICCKVQEIRGPEDWITHLFHDIPPFFCTFNDCEAGILFERKEDWVKHENESHGMREWWICSVAHRETTFFTGERFRKHIYFQHGISEDRAKTPRRDDEDTEQLSSVHDSVLTSLSTLPEACHRIEEPGSLVPCAFCFQYYPRKELIEHHTEHLETQTLYLLKIFANRVGINNNWSIGD